MVEDEPRLRTALAELLRDSAFGWRRILQAGNADEALALVREHAPEVAFLDIRMPGMSGLQLAARLPAGTRIVFVTAFDAHAIEAFEAGAIDYLLKPVTKDRLQKTLERLRDRTPLSLEALQKWIGPLAPPPREPEPLRWITVTSGRRTRWIAAEDVLFFRSDHKVTSVECRDGSYIIDLPIKELAERLDPRSFQQIHRSVVVNLRAIAWLERLDGEGGVLHLKEQDATLPVSAAFMRVLRDRT